MRDLYVTLVNLGCADLEAVDCGIPTLTKVTNWRSGVVGADFDLNEDLSVARSGIEGWLCRHGW